MKTCTKCKSEKPTNDFAKDLRHTDGYQSHCRACCSAREKQRRIDNPELMSNKSRARYKRDKDKWMSRIVRKKYGITLDEWRELRSKGCAICGKQTGMICLDHDHITGKIRGVLCDCCNRAIGYMYDDSIRLRKAAEYLERNAV